MALLLNVDSGRELREGDTVRLHGGSIGTVIGFDLMSESPLVVQSKKGQMSQHSANDVVLLREGPIRLEPLPPIVQVIQEGGIKSYQTAGSMICVKIPNTTLLTLIPKSPEKLRDVLESSDAEFGETLLKTLERSFVTRLPHLVKLKATA
jgi:hypothetical protein